MIFIGNAFAIGMIEGDASLSITEISKETFLEAKKMAKSIVGHPEIAEMFDLELNRESITLTKGDVLYVVSLKVRPNANQEVTNGMKYKFNPNEKDYVFKMVKVI